MLQVEVGDKLPAKHYHYDRNLAAERADDILPGAGSTSEIPSATATIKPPSTRLQDVFISVKTTKHYHSHRLPVILKTWFQLAKAQVSDGFYRHLNVVHDIKKSQQLQENAIMLLCKGDAIAFNFLRRNGNTDGK